MEINRDNSPHTGHPPRSTGQISNIGLSSSSVCLLDRLAHLLFLIMMGVIAILANQNYRSCQPYLVELGMRDLTVAISFQSAHIIPQVFPLASDEPGTSTSLLPLKFEIGCFSGAWRLEFEVSGSAFSPSVAWAINPEPHRFGLLPPNYLLNCRLV